MFSKIGSAISGKANDDASSDAEEQSLSTILPTHEDRTSLLLLVASCTEYMRKDVLDIFDPNEIGKSEEPVHLSPSDERPKDEVELKKTEAEQSQDSKSSEQDAAKAASAEAKAQKDAEDRAQKEYERRVKELNSDKMKELKEAALNHFDEWRSHVLERIGEAVNQQPESSDKKPVTGSKDTGDKDAKSTPAGVEEDELANEALTSLYPSQATPLRNLSRPKRVLILHSLLLLLLSLEAYTAESRVLLLHLCSSLGLAIEILSQDERSVATGLLESAKQQMNADEETKKKADSNIMSRRWKVGLGAVAGAALIGVTGGLAAPLLAAGVGSVMGGLGLGATAAAGYLGALAGSAPLVGVLFGAYGGRMTGQMVDNYAKEVQDFAFLPVRKPSRFTTDSSQKDMRRLRVAIGISGWLTEETDVVKPWTVIGDDTEAFALRWELEALVNLGNSLTTYIKSAAWGWAKSEIISHTVFAAISAALWPLGIAKAARMIDNPYSVARSRADKAGKVLADALINKVQGERPVTLVGYSMGARVIYSCLDELASRKAFGLVESIVLAGAQTPSDSVNWRRIRTVVSGRVINVYSKNDYLLAFLERTSSMQLGISGLQSVDGVKGIENVDVSEFVDGHTQYRYLTGQVLRKIGFEDTDAVECEKQERQLQQQEKKEQQERDQNEKTGRGDSDEEVEKLEKEVEQKNKAALAMDWLSKRVGSMTTSVKDSVTGGKKKGDEKSTQSAEKSKDLEDEKDEETKFEEATKEAIQSSEPKSSSKTGKATKQAGGTLGTAGSTVVDF